MLSSEDWDPLMNSGWRHISCWHKNGEWRSVDTWSAGVLSGRQQLLFWSWTSFRAHPGFVSSLQIAREHGIRFFETSAKANINIEKAFLTLAEDILKKVREPLALTRPAAFLSFSEEVPPLSTSSAIWQPQSSAINLAKTKSLKCIKGAQHWSRVLSLINRNEEFRAGQDRSGDLRFSGEVKQIHHISRSTVGFRPL